MRCNYLTRLVEAVIVVGVPLGMVQLLNGDCPMQEPFKTACPQPPVITVCGASSSPCTQRRNQQKFNDFFDCATSEFEIECKDGQAPGDNVPCYTDCACKENAINQCVIDADNCTGYFRIRKIWVDCAPVEGPRSKSKNGTSKPGARDRLEPVAQ